MQNKRITVLNLNMTNTVQKKKSKVRRLVNGRGGYYSWREKEIYRETNLQTFYR